MLIVRDLDGLLKLIRVFLHIHAGDLRKHKHGHVLGRDREIFLPLLAVVLYLGQRSRFHIGPIPCQVRRKITVVKNKDGDCGFNEANISKKCSFNKSNVRRLVLSLSPSGTLGGQITDLNSKRRLAVVGHLVRL
jgi:hypothetical protein